MATLKLRAFRCVEESDEVGADSPYFVVFHGQPNNPGGAQITSVRRESWDNEVDSGDLFTPNAVVAKDIDTSTFVLVALMEEDVDRDIAGTAANNVENWMRTMFSAYSGSGVTPHSYLAEKLIPELRRAINNYRSNDDIIDVKWLPVSTLNGDLKLLRFSGDGASYRVRFAAGA